MNEDNNFPCIVIVMFITMAILLAGCFIKLSHIKDIMQAQFDYETEMQFCMQGAMDYYAPCVLERDEDGSYNWYFNPNEGEL